jgi:hypothetical protein
MKIKFQTPVSPIADKTTASTGFKDTDINTVYLFLVNKGTGKVYSVVKGENIQDGAEENKKTVEVVLTFGTDASADAAYYCYVVTNISLTQVQMTSYKGYSYTELSSVLMLDEYQKTSINQGITMWGMTPEKEAFTKDKFPQTLGIKLLRSLARVDVGLGKFTAGTWDGKIGDSFIPFRIKSVHILRANQGYLFMPKESERNAINIGLNANAETYEPEVATPSNIGENIVVNDFRHLYENANKHDTELTKSVKNIMKIYIPESDVILGGTSFDTNHVNRCAIIVGGFYKGGTQMSYYRIDFNNDNSGELMNILRNNQYILSITSVLGDGYPTPEEAYINQSMHMQVKILDWKSNNSNIVFDGTNWFSIEKMQLRIGGDLGNKATLSVSSTIPSSNWEMVWKDTEVYPTDQEYKPVNELSVEGVIQVQKPNPPLMNDQEVGVLSFNSLKSKDIVKKYLFIKVNSRLRIRITVDIFPDGYTIKDWEKDPDYVITIK